MSDGVFRTGRTCRSPAEARPAVAEPLPFPCPAGYRHFDRVSQDDCYPCIRFLYRLDAARAAVSSGEPFHESRYREHDDEGNHIWDHPVSHREDGA